MLFKLNVLVDLMGPFWERTNNKIGQALTPVWRGERLPVAPRAKTEAATKALQSFPSRPFPMTASPGRILAFLGPARGH